MVILLCNEHQVLVVTEHQRQYNRQSKHNIGCSVVYILALRFKIMRHMNGLRKYKDDFKLRFHVRLAC